MPPGLLRLQEPLRAHRRAPRHDSAVLIDAAQTGWYEGKYCPRLAVYDSMQVVQCGTASPDSTASEEGFGFGPIDEQSLFGRVGQSRNATSNLCCLAFNLVDLPAQAFAALASLSQ